MDGDWFLTVVNETGQSVFVSWPHPPCDRHQHQCGLCSSSGLSALQALSHLAPHAFHLLQDLSVSGLSNSWDCNCPDKNLVSSPLILCCLCLTCFVRQLSFPSRHQLGTEASRKHCAMCHLLKGRWAGRGASPKFQGGRHWGSERLDGLPRSLGH